MTKQIVDAMLIANEVIDSRIKAKWSFFLVVGEKLRFGSKWVNWIRWCISTICFFVFVNGSPSIV